METEHDSQLNAAGRSFRPMAFAACLLAACLAAGVIVPVRAADDAPAVSAGDDENQKAGDQGGKDDKDGKDDEEKDGDGGGAIAHIVVTANRLATDEKQVASSVTVIDAAEIERKQARTVAEALRDVPGFQVSNMGGPGTATNFYLRGGNTGSTVVLVDGMPLNNPGELSRSFDINTLTLDNVDRIEVVRGPQSMLYGADAMAGVIQIFTKKGGGPPSGTAFVEAGSRGTVITRAETRAGNDKIDFSFGAGLHRADGFNIAPAGNERDHYDNSSFSFNIGGKPTEALRFDLFTRYQKAHIDADRYDGLNVVDYDGAKTVMETFSIRPQAKLSLLDDRWVQTLGFSYSHYDNDFNDKLRDAFDYESGGEFRYKAYSARFDYQSDFRLHETNTLTVGFDHTREWFDGESVMADFDWWSFPPLPLGTKTVTPLRGEATRLTGFYLQDNLQFADRLFITLGVRNDHHSEFGDRTTYRGTIAYLLPTNTKLKATYGTGFKAPTLSQLHYPPGPYPGWGGNPNLRPETSKGWDVGAEQSLFDERLALGVTYFDNRYKNMIISDENHVYNNISRARTKGVESTLRWRIVDGLDFNAAYTYLDAKGTERDGEERWLPKRSRHAVALGLHWRFLDRGDLDVRYRYNSRRREGARYMGGYGVVDVAASWQATEHLAITARAENLFDKKYENSIGYRSQPAAFYGGVRFTF